MSLRNSLRLLLSIAAPLAMMTGCSGNTNPSVPNAIPTAIGPVVQDASTGPLKNCRFQNPTPTYAFQSTISPNPIHCDQGIATAVTVLTPNSLPSGILFSQSQMSLTGSANEKVNQAPYLFYLENASNYLIIPLNLTIK